MQTPRVQAGARDRDCERAAAAIARGDLDGAAAAYRKAIQRGTRNVDAHNNLGAILAQRGDLDGAIPLFEAVLALVPGSPDARANLANARASRGVERFRTGHVEEAVEDLGRSLELDPGSAQTASDLGAVLIAGRQFPAAVVCCRRAIALAPDFAPAHTNLGSALLALGHVDEAAEVLERAMALAPADAKPAVNLAALEEKRGRLTRAEALARQALTLAPRAAEAHYNLALALLQQGELAPSPGHFREALALDPGNPSYHSGLLHSLNYAPDVAPEVVAAEHRRFSQAFGGERPRPAPRAGVMGRRLRIGYLSPDFRRHSVSYFFEPLLRMHDRGAVEVTCYADVPRPDEVTERLAALADRWRSTASMPDAALRERIASDGIDVLVDLAGHTASNRMRLFAGRAAPVQFTYLGYPNTTGLETMDYRVTDAIADPVGEADAWHAEELVRIEGGFLCYSAPLPAEQCPEVGPPPSLASGRVTFGSFNNLAKLNPAVIEAWASLLARVPGSGLLLKARGLGEEQIRERIWSRFEARGIARARVELALPAGCTADHLATYGRMDIALDTFPYNGTTTTCEALWMGVPVVTFAGRAHAGRVGASLLGRVGLEELAPATLEVSLEVAARLAGDPDRLAALRRSMRDRLRVSPLMDPARLVRALEAAYQRACS